MTDGSGISCPFYENDCRGPPPKKVALDCGSEAYFVELSSLGAAGSVGVHSSFSTYSLHVIARFGTQVSTLSTPLRH